MKRRDHRRCVGRGFLEAEILALLGPPARPAERAVDEVKPVIGRSGSDHAGRGGNGYDFWRPPRMDVWRPRKEPEPGARAVPVPVHCPSRARPLPSTRRSIAEVSYLITCKYSHSRR